MEILSDATFKGKVNVGNKVFFGKPGTEMILNDGVFSIYDGFIDFSRTRIYLSDGSCGGTISKWSDLGQYISRTFTSPSIPANCTAFEFTGTAISDTNKTHMIQVQNTSTGKSVIAETWMTTNKKPAMSFAGCTSTIAAGTYTAMVI